MEKGNGSGSAQSGLIGEPFADFELFETWAEGGRLAYKFDVSPATYQVTLRFAELAVAKVGKRIMKITLESNSVETALDVYALAGSSAALDRIYTVPVNDGQLNIDFAKVGVGDNPMVAAVEVTYAGPLPTPTPTPLPTPTATSPPYVLRVNVGSTTYTDKSALVWVADKAFATGSWGYVGGTTGKSSTAVAGTEDATLYQKYRTKMTEYKLTVPNGAYQVRLRFAEFSTSTAGARAMKITLEGVVAENALDVYALAGKATAFDNTYPVSVTDGVLNIGFARATGASLDPVISAIEVR